MTLLCVCAQLLGARNGLQDLRVSLLAQLAHRNSLLVASQHNASLLRHTLPSSSSSSAAAVTAAASPDPPPKQQQQPVWLKRSFVSLQLLKVSAWSGLWFVLQTVWTIVRGLTEIEVIFVVLSNDILFC